MCTVLSSHFVPFKRGGNKGALQPLANGDDPTLPQNPTLTPPPHPNPLKCIVPECVCAQVWVWGSRKTKVMCQGLCAVCLMRRLYIKVNILVVLIVCGVELCFGSLFVCVRVIKWGSLFIRICDDEKKSLPWVRSLYTVLWVLLWSPFVYLQLWGKMRWFHFRNKRNKSEFNSGYFNILYISLEAGFELELSRFPPNL